MRVSRAQAEHNRARVIDTASHLFRERGLNGIGVADLMKAAGLTHGGFYRQFDSKEDLVVAACRHSVAQSREAWSKVLTKAANSRLAALVRFYLSRSHRDQPGVGCPFAALGPDAARAGNAVREAFAEGIEQRVAMLGELLRSRDAGTRRKQAIAMLSTMVGALLLSRAAGDEALSREILDAAADELITGHTAAPDTGTHP